MGCIRVTPRPSYYRELALQAQPEEPILDDKVTVCFKIAGPTGWFGTHKQAAIREVVASVLHDRGCYHRQYNYSDDLGYYTWENLLLHQTTLSIGPVEMTGLNHYEPLFDALAERCWRPDGETTITYFPKSPSMPMLCNLLTIIESRRPLIERALELKEPLVPFIDHGLALGVSLSAFSYPRVEAAAYLMAQACRMAEATGKARMKPCDMSNPRFQMRSWLLRLGFIGETFERPRRTLMEALDGDSAFFTDSQKQSAMIKRRIKQEKAI